MGTPPVIPEDRASSKPIPSPLVFPDPQPSLTESRHLGGIALNDPSQGSRVQVWTCRTDGTSVFIRAPVVAETILFTGTRITEVSLAFDQNMRPFVAFMDGPAARYFWFDTQDNQQKISTLPEGCTSPRCCLDDDRTTQVSSSDIILGYVRERSLFYRQQRDRYTIERFLSPSVKSLKSVGMGRNLRLQFEVEP